MNREEVLYLAPYLISLFLSFGIFLYAWRHRHVRSAKAYTFFVAGQTASILGFIFELISPNLEIKLLWDKFQWLTETVIVIVFFLIFAIQFSEHKIRHLKVFWSFWLTFPLIFIALLLTDDIHHLIYPNPHLSTDFPFPELKYDFTPVVYIYSVAYIFGSTFYGIFILIKRALQRHEPHRQQFLIVAAGFFLPIVFAILTLANIRIAPQRDPAPFSLAMGNLIIAWGLFRYRLFDLIPIAREHMIENMKDPVMVLDPKNRVVDMNPAALKILGKNNSQVIGRPASEVFAKWPVIISELEYLDVEQREISIREGGDTFFYDVSISSIFSNRRQLIGRIVVARDVTKYKTLESGYRLLSEELEQRVQERTEELRHSAERYRAVVENQTEFIVRWKPDGTRTFANEAYCRYWGLTYEQALAINFMSHVKVEDRPAVEEKFSRLKSGNVNSETEVHQIIGPDGSIRWHEWTDQAIHNESGQLIEIQSVGRDITERKQAEAALHESEAIYRKAIEVAGAVPYRQTYPGDEFHINYEFIGDGIRQITGYGPEEFNETLWDSLVQESYLLGELANYSWREAVHQVRSGASPIWQCEHRIKARNGKTRWVYEAAVEIRDKDGRSRGSIGLYQDITERKHAEANLVEAYETTLEGWAKALELRDKETEGHSRRVTESTLVVAREMGIDEQDLIHIRHGALLHDIGKMAIPDEILRKPGPLTGSERQIVMQHPQAAYDLLMRIPHLKKALDIPYCHHEKWDGTGYPRGLKGEEIPLAARIFAVVDVCDALSNDRVYRKAWSKEKVSEYLRAESGKHFDPAVVMIFLQLLEQGKI